MYKYKNLKIAVDVSLLYLTALNIIKTKRCLKERN